MSRIEDRLAVPAKPMYKGRWLKEIYLEAAEILDGRGLEKQVWCNSSTGAVCVGGAIMAAAGVECLDFDERKKIFQPLDDYFRPAFFGNWNDRPETTKADAIALLRKVAEGL